jgi:hypothetical protein
VIAFGCSISSPEVYRRWAERGIERAREPSSPVFALQAAGSIFRSYNLLLEQVAAREDLESLVLVHEDAEIVDPDFCRKLRRALTDPDVGVVGCVGAMDAHSIAWWDDAKIVGSFVLRYPELGGGEFSSAAPGVSDQMRPADAAEVDVLDGFMLALAPWAVHNVRFDEALGPHWGYDFDYCMQVRAAKRKVVVADLRVAHHRSLALIGDPEPWIAAHMRAAEKWDSGPSGGALDWKLRARRAEAEAVVARLEGAATLLQADARTAQHARRMKELTSTTGWRLTAPLRRLNAARKAGWRQSH